MTCPSPPSWAHWPQVRVPPHECRGDRGQHGESSGPFQALPPALGPGHSPAPGSVAKRPLRAWRRAGWVCISQRLIRRSLQTRVADAETRAPTAENIYSLACGRKGLLTPDFSYEVALWVESTHTHACIQTHTHTHTHTHKGEGNIAKHRQLWTSQGGVSIIVHFTVFSTFLYLQNIIKHSDNCNSDTRTPPRPRL